MYKESEFRDNIVNTINRYVVVIIFLNNILLLKILNLDKLELIFVKFDIHKVIRTAASI